MVIARFHIWIVVSAIAVGGVMRQANGEDVVDEKLLAALQGEWDPQSTVSNGKEKEIDREKMPSFKIEGRHMFIRFQDQNAGKFEIKQLVAKDSMGHIDYEMIEPRRENVRVKQLFKLDGDKLITCVTTPPGGDRPTELTSPAGSNRLLTVSHRRKKK